MDRVCLMQIWVEVLNGDPKHFKPQHKNEIIGVLRKMKEWEKGGNVMRCGPYGTQKGYKRKIDMEEQF